jgi:hypothetical protein
MVVLGSATRRSVTHANATVRLCAAREELWRAQSDHADARGTLAEAGTLHRVSEATAEVATREQWLHWVAHATTIQPAADGEWGLVPDAQRSRKALGRRLSAARPER